MNIENDYVNSREPHPDPIEQTEQEIETAAVAAASKVADAAARTEDAAAETAGEATAKFVSVDKKIREAGDRIRLNARDLGEAAGEKLQAHPVLSVGVAFVAGIALASLLRRNG